MTLVERLSNALSPDNSKTDQGADSDENYDSTVRMDAFEGLPPRKIEKIFLKLSHNQRFDCVAPDSRRIPRRKWWEFSSYLNINDESNSRWGLEQTHTEPRDGLRVCKYDDAPVDKRPVEKRSGESTRSNEKEQTERGFGWRRILKTEFKRTSAQSEAKTESDEQAQNRVIVECETDRDDCKLNRQAFVKFGRKSVVRGSGNKNQLDTDIDRVLGELELIRIMSGDSTHEEGGNPPEA